ncbi:DMT family transporter [Latilactobacillus fuchuensis]|uniref:DMT family transporter n=1 Tax=Latilactobacillus fuchuensis TaxID=164393 RepID=UPI0020C8276A|nr:multidrug efflux SMR transporter [Latilactobacillus fuchuensis]MCP8858422.1 multidrug efflux SMR transporter [Latilactobacillus fuchuensis]
MTWFYLLLAGLLEVVWSSTMKLSEGFTRLSYSLETIVAMIFSSVFLSLALRHLPLSIAYPLWTGIGAVGAILVGVIFFKDQLSPMTWFFVALLIIGIIGIKMTSSH